MRKLLAAFLIAITLYRGYSAGELFVTIAILALGGTWLFYLLRKDRPKKKKSLIKRIVEIPLRYFLCYVCLAAIYGFGYLLDASVDYFD